MHDHGLREQSHLGLVIFKLTIAANVCQASVLRETPSFPETPNINSKFGQETTKTIHFSVTDIYTNGQLCYSRDR